MAGIEQNIERARAAGFEVVDHFAVPSAAWWDEYYTPLEARTMEGSRRDADPELAAAIAETRREIDLFRRCNDVYGYVFYLIAGGRGAGPRGPRSHLSG